MISATLLLVGLFGFTNPSFATKPPIDVPPNGAKSYVLDDPTVEMNHTYVDFSWSFVDAPSLFTETVVACVNLCKGEKHFAHESCDFSCDEQCTQGKHPFDFDARFSSSTSANVEGAVEADCAAFGTPRELGGCIEEILQAAYDTMTDGRYRIKDSFKCWNTVPCSWEGKGFKSRQVTVNVTYQVYRLAKGPNDTMTRVNGPSKTVPMGEFQVPDKNDPYVGSYVKCLCNVLIPMEDRLDHSSIGGVQYGGELAGAAVPTKVLKEFGFAMTFENMHACTVSATNPTSMPVTFVVNPGTVCVSNDKAFQDEVTTGAMTLTLPPGKSASVTVPTDHHPDEPVFGLVTGQGYCINMLKKEPIPKLKYWPTMSRSPELVKLAQFAAAERFKGPWTQTRFWIATDNATLDEVRKVLLPRPNEGMYVRVMHEAATAANVDFAAPAKKRCLEPKLIVGSSAPPEATEWFVRLMGRVDPKGLVDWVTKNPAAFKPIFEGTSLVYGKVHAATVARSLCGTNNPEFQRAGLDFLLRAVPFENRAAVAEAGGLSGLTGVMKSDNPKLLGQALDVAEAYKSKSCVIALANMSAKASPELKKRASQLLAGLK